MARIVFRVLIGAGLGSLLGLLLWGKASSRSWLLGEPDALATYVLPFAGLGAIAVFTLDILGPEVPLLPQRRRSSAKEDLARSDRIERMRFIFYVAGILVLAAAGFTVAWIVSGFWRSLPGAI